jgi:hypothetical protein
MPSERPVVTARAMPKSAAMVSGPSETVPAGPVSQPPSGVANMADPGPNSTNACLNRESGAVVHRLQLLGAGSASQPRVGVATADGLTPGRCRHPRFTLVAVCQIEAFHTHPKVASAPRSAKVASGRVPRSARANAPFAVERRA